MAHWALSRQKNKQTDLINARNIFILPELATRTRNFPDTGRRLEGALEPALL